MATTLCRNLKETFVKLSRVPVVYAHTLQNTKKAESTSVEEKSTNHKDVSVQYSEEKGLHSPEDSKVIYRANAGSFIRIKCIYLYFNVAFRSNRVHTISLVRQQSFYNKVYSKKIYTYTELQESHF